MSNLIPDSDYEIIKGAQIGTKGTSRTAYEHKSNAERIIKFANNGTPATNFLEWYIWAALKDSKYKNMFAQCYSISKTGDHLEMEKLTPLSNSDMPAYHALELPAWFQDKKPGNFGKSDKGEIKCLDYGLINFSALLNMGVKHSYDPFSDIKG